MKTLVSILLVAVLSSTAFGQVQENQTVTKAGLRGDFQVVTAATAGDLDGDGDTDYTVGGVWFGQANYGAADPGAPTNFTVPDVEAALLAEPGRLVLWDTLGNRWELEQSVPIGPGETLRYTALNINGDIPPSPPSIGRGFISQEIQCSAGWISLTVPEQGTGISATLQSIIETHNMQQIAACAIGASTVDSFAALEALDASSFEDGQPITLQGYYSGASYGGGLFFLDTNNSLGASAANSGTVAVANTGSPDEYWVRIGWGEPTAEMFGAVKDDPGGFDNALAISACKAAHGFCKIGEGTFYIQSSITMFPGETVTGSGKGETILRQNADSIADSNFAGAIPAEVVQVDSNVNGARHVAFISDGFFFNDMNGITVSHLTIDLNGDAQTLYEGNRVCLSGVMLTGYNNTITGVEVYGMRAAAAQNGGIGSESFVIWNSPAAGNSLPDGGHAGITTNNDVHDNAASFPGAAASPEVTCFNISTGVPKTDGSFNGGHLVSGNRIYNLPLDATHASTVFGIAFTGVNVQITGNDFNNIDGRGIWMNGGSPVNNALIADNTFHNVRGGMEMQAAQPTAIWENITVRGNSIHLANFSPTAPAVLYFGFRAFGSSSGAGRIDGFVFEDNYITAAPLADLPVGSTIDGIRFQMNRGPFPAQPTGAYNRCRFSNNVINIDPADLTDGIRVVLNHIWDRNVRSLFFQNNRDARGKLYDVSFAQTFPSPNREARYPQSGMHSNAESIYLTDQRSLTENFVGAGPAYGNGWTFAGTAALGHLHPPGADSENRLGIASITAPVSATVDYNLLELPGAVQTNSSDYDYVIDIDARNDSWFGGGARQWASWIGLSSNQSAVADPTDGIFVYSRNNDVIGRIVSGGVIFDTPDLSGGNPVQWFRWSIHVESDWNKVTFRNDTTGAVEVLEEGVAGVTIPKNLTMTPVVLFNSEASTQASNLYLDKFSVHLIEQP